MCKKISPDTGLKKLVDSVPTSLILSETGLHSHEATRAFRFDTQVGACMATIINELLRAKRKLESKASPPELALCVSVAAPSFRPSFYAALRCVWPRWWPWVDYLSRHRRYVAASNSTRCFWCWCAWESFHMVSNCKSHKLSFLSMRNEADMQKLSIFKVRIFFKIF